MRWIIRIQQQYLSAPSFILWSFIFKRCPHCPEMTPEVSLNFISPHLVSWAARGGVLMSLYYVHYMDETLAWFLCVKSQVINLSLEGLQRSTYRVVLLERFFDYSPVYERWAPWRAAKCPQTQNVPMDILRKEMFVAASYKMFLNVQWPNSGTFWVWGHFAALQPPSFKCWFGLRQWFLTSDVDPLG